LFTVKRFENKQGWKGENRNLQDKLVQGRCPAKPTKKVEEKSQTCNRRLAEGIEVKRHEMTLSVVLTQTNNGLKPHTRWEKPTFCIHDLKVVDELPGAKVSIGR
jgi:hypothetical protein